MFCCDWVEIKISGFVLIYYGLSNRVQLSRHPSTHIRNLRTFTTDTTSQLDILGHDCNTLGVDSTQVGVFKETDQVGFGSLLKSKDGRSLESKITLEVLGDLTNKTLEGQLADQQISRLLVPTDLTKSDSSWAVSVRFLDTSSCRSRFTSCLGGQLLTRSLSSG